MFLGINIFWALLRAHFYHRLTVGAQVSLSRAQNTFKAYLCFISRTLYKRHLTCDIVNITLALLEFLVYNTTRITKLINKCLNTNCEYILFLCLCLFLYFCQLIFRSFKHAFIQRGVNNARPKQNKMAGVNSSFEMAVKST